MILKELFNNALRHSGAGNVKTSACLNQDHQLSITVEDDGKGFDVTVLKSGNGMRNINNRAKRVHGLIETISSPGEGTRFTLLIKRIPHLY